MSLRLIIVLVFFSVHIAEHASATSGSAYSRFGIGERLYLSSIRSVGLGGAAIALRGSDHFNLTNPASWSDFHVVQFTGSFYYENIRSEDRINSGGITTGSLNGAMLGLPILPSRGVTLSFGFAPMSRVGYNIETEKPIDGGIQVTQHIGSGTVSNLILGASYRLHRDISIGGMMLYRTGNLRYEWDNRYSVSGYISGYTLRRLEGKGLAGQFGLLYRGILPPRREHETGPLSIGVVFTTPSYLNATEDYRINYGIGVDTTITTSGTVDIPYSLGIGFAYSLDRRNLVAMDVRYEPWDDFRKFGVGDSHLRNSYRYSLGWERRGQFEEIGAGFFERTSFRVGFLYNASYFTINGTPINETFFTIGAGIPLSGVAVLDIGAQIGVRGTTENNLQRDTLFRLYFSLNMFERWFVPPRIE
jgi:hypothetical protein